MAADPGNRSAAPRALHPVVSAGVAWGGGALFVGALTYFLYTYLVTFGETGRGGDTARSIAWDVALFSVFALHHSIFARQPVRATVARFVPPALERSFYVWIASLLFIAVCRWWRPVAGIAWQLSGPIAWPLDVAQMVGIWLSLRSAAIIDIWELSGIRQIQARDPDSEPKPVRFEASGPYAWVRHPIYLGWVMIVFAAPVMTMTRLVFAIVSTAYIVAAIPFEERTLLDTTGGAYASYVARVKRKLIPRVY